MALLYKMFACNVKGLKKEEKRLIKFIIDNKESFVPVTEHDKKWFYVIVKRRYFIYKHLRKLKRKK